MTSANESLISSTSLPLKPGYIKSSLLTIWEGATWSQTSSVMFAHYRVKMLWADRWEIVTSGHDGRSVIHLDLCHLILHRLTTNLDWCYSYQLTSNCATDMKCFLKALMKTRLWMHTLCGSHAALHASRIGMYVFAVVFLWFHTHYVCMIAWITMGIFIKPRNC